MHYRILFAIWTFALLTAAAAPAVEVSIEPDRMLAIDGRRTFIRGIYKNPDDDAVLKEVAEAGFNLTRCGRDKQALDRLQAHGLYGWCDTGSAAFVPADGSANEERLAAMVREVSGHPAFLTWEIPDEIMWNTWLDIDKKPVTNREKLDALRAETAREADELARGHEILRRLDPKHPVWMNHAAGGSLDVLANYARGADIIACDLYPLMPYPTGALDISRSVLGSIGLTATRMQATAPAKPVWMVLQGMAWGDFENPVFTLQPRPSQYPSFEESRFMAYDSIVSGARGVLYWGTHIGGTTAPIWGIVMKTARDLADHGALLAAPDAALVPEIETRYFGILPWPRTRGNMHVRALGKMLDGETHWIIVNPCPFPVGYTVGGLDALNGTSYTGDDGSTAAVSNGSFTGVLPRYGVRILSADPTRS